MPQFSFHQTPMGFNIEEKGWRFDFRITFQSIDFVLPITVPENVPEAEREETAKANFKAWVDQLASEAATF